jgi:hypothetical protein
LCKRLGVRLTVKRGQKRVYKSVAVLKRQCAKKKKRRTRKKPVKKRKVKKKRKRKVKRRRKFGTTSSVKDTNLSRKEYIIIGKEKPEEGAMSMYEPVETIYGYGSFDRYFNKSKRTMLHETSFVGINNIPTIYDGELIPIFTERPHIRGDVFYHEEELDNKSLENFRKFNYEIEGNNFDWYVFNPFNNKGLNKEEDIISLHEGLIRHKRKRKGHSRVNIPTTPKKRRIVIHQRRSNTIPIYVNDYSDDDDYSGIEFGKKRRKKVKKRRTQKK